MQDLDKVIDYFCEYDMQERLMSFSMKQDYQSISMEQCDYTFASAYVNDGKKEAILQSLFSNCEKDSDGLARQSVNQYVEGKISLEDFIDQFPFKDRRFLKKTKNEVLSIRDENDFYIFYPVFCYEDNKSNKKTVPLLTFMCGFEHKKIKVKKIRPNLELFALVIAAHFDYDISEARKIYENEINATTKAIDSLQGCDNLMDLYLLVEGEFQKAMKINISLQNFSPYQGWQMLNQASIVFGTADDMINTCFRDEMLTLQRFVKASGMIPSAVCKYLSGSHQVENIYDLNLPPVYHFGSYTDAYAVNERQWQLVRCAEASEVLCVEGPPGTGKTTLLKEIIADNLVKKAASLLEVWDKPWTELSGTQKTVFCSPLGGENLRSIIVASTNQKAVNNIEVELNKEPEYFNQFVSRLDLPESIGQGMLCAKLGNSKNIIGFYEGIFLPFCEYLEHAELSLEDEQTVRDNFKSIYQKVEDINQKITCLINSKHTLGFLHDHSIAHVKLCDEDYQKQREDVNRKMEDSRSMVDKLKNECSECEQSDRGLEDQINELQSDVTDNQRYIKQLYIDEEAYSKLGMKKYFKFLFPRVKQLLDKYPTRRYLLDLIGERKQMGADMDASVVELCKEIGILKEQIDTNKSQIKSLNSALDDLSYCAADFDKKRSLIGAYLQAAEKVSDALGERPEQLDEKGVYGLRNAVELLHLRKQLFHHALMLYEIYIIKQKEPILKNLILMITKSDPYINWCQAFYHNDEPYPKEKKKALQTLWETFFLCFPVISTTLHSFKKSVFQFIPQLCDLLLVDECGQINPYYVLAPLYRMRRVVFVGDVNQIEPIKVVPPGLLKEAFAEQLGEERYEWLCLDQSSVQSFAVRASDVCERVEGQPTGVILNEHRRCEESIMAFSNEYIYKNVLKIKDKDKDGKLFGCNLLALDIRGYKNGNNTNDMEIEACKQLVTLYRNKYGDEITKEIGIITPFKKQADKLKTVFGDAIDVGTVHTFQGDEKRFIIFSCVVDDLKKNLSGLLNFIGGKGNMLNVAFSRAREQFIFVGNFDAARQSRNYLMQAFQTIQQYGTTLSLFEECKIKNETDIDWKGAIQVLSGRLSEAGNDEISIYLQSAIPTRIVDTPQLHNQLLNDLVGMAKKEVCIISPWISGFVVTDDFLSVVHQQLANQVSFMVSFGYRKSSLTLDNVSEIVDKDMSWGKEHAVRAIEGLKQELGEYLKYQPPTHVKLLIIDETFMFIGSLNWLMNSGKTGTKEISCLITDREMIRYVKEQYIQA
ncbi:MAG: AAA domain-containing protein [Lachnospiraceae bacterium]